MIVQIYEIQTPQEAEKCVELGVDHIGSVLVSGKDWRSPILKEVMLVSADGACKSSLIPLFMDGETLYRALDYYRPDFVHFCDSLTDAGGLERDLGAFIQMQGLLKETFPDIGIMRSIPIQPQGASEDFPALSIAARLQPVTDIFLTDTWLGQGPVVGYIGITGRPADWDMARELVLQSRIPVILAGGLSPENVREAILKVTPSGADSCTRTNLVDSRGAPVRFRKDFRKVARFVEEVRGAERALKLRREQIRQELKALKADLREREAALPAHSVRPHQILAVEALEEEIALKEKELENFKDHE